ncbi:ankyrin repeat/KH domain protein [Perilla frutescens var. hirtella]|uniref:Ankyrin repeat/KH domain protein n=1 Tax=Perilla frutescens var. hirtella TaxID=608512 RepID=A0AAD4JR15_PERFH|nr:ankyrin repeat/KH domain protein [Perilla frutescens var. hirtella]KAH6837769.1 ankyrin repeat/KH domain protein [Perilla frutescens var. hirtella]
MKLVWSPESASKAFIDTVKSCKLFNESSAAELVSAMAAGWNAQLVVETWRRGGSIAASVGLAVATQHSGGRHICVVPDEESKADYVEAMRESGQPSDVVVGRPEEAMEGLEGIDFLVVDCRRNDFARILTVARLGHRGAVLICKNASSRAANDFRWRTVLDGKSRIVRTVFLPVGNGLHIAHVGATGGGGAAAGKGQSRWIKHIDRRSGEEIVIRK